MRLGQQGGNPPQTVLRNMVYARWAFGRMNTASRLVADREQAPAKAVASVDQPSGGDL